MKKTPRKIKHWAAEAYIALEKSLILFSEEYPDPTDEEKFELVNLATAFAAMNRGIKDKQIVAQAYEHVLNNLKIDYENTKPGEDIYHSIMFLIAYMDSHISFGTFKENKSDDIMDYLSNNYEISIPI